MDQPVFDFTAPMQPRGSLRSRHCSSQGALAAEEVSGRQMVVIMAAYSTYGPLTDIEVEAKTGIQKSSVIPRRRSLMHAGLVVEVGMRVNPATRKPNMTFGLKGHT